MANRIQGEGPFRFLINEKRPAGSARWHYHAFTGPALERTHARVIDTITRITGGYEPSRIQSMPALASQLGVNTIWVKDEGTRFTRGAIPGDDRAMMMSFKPLGALAAVEPLIAKHGRSAVKMLASATDGNHGLGLAFIAKQFGIPCTIFVPAETIDERKAAIARLGATVVVSAGNYDRSCLDCREAAAANPGWFEVSDVSTRGYQEIPINIMLGYSLMVKEFLDQTNEARRPTVVFVQAGVGTMAGAVTASLRLYLTGLPPKHRPKIVVCEPVRAAGILHYMGEEGQDITTGTFDGDLATKAAGLSCGTPASIGFEILRRQADAFMTVPEPLIDLAARWMFADSHGMFHRLVAGESGAFGLAALMAVQRVPGLGPLRDYLGLKLRNEYGEQDGDPPETRVLVINTEGPTNPAFAERIRQGRVQPLIEAWAEDFADLTLMPSFSADTRSMTERVAAEIHRSRR